jgi:hypothetical protein
MRWEMAYPDKPWDGGFRESMGIDVAAVRAESDEFVGMLQSEMPCARGSHGHASENDPSAVDGITSANGLDGLEDIGFASPAVTVLHAAEWMKFDVIGLRRRFALGFAGIKPREEAQFAQS